MIVIKKNDLGIRKMIKLYIFDHFYVLRMSFKSNIVVKVVVHLARRMNGLW